MTDLEQDAIKAARIAARHVAEKYDGFVEYDDLEQEALLWLLKHGNRVAHATMDDGTIYQRQLVAEIIDPLARMAKRAKVNKLGWDIRDLARYNRRTVEAALPAVWDISYRPTSPEEGPRAKVDPALRGNFEAVAMDLRRAVDAVCTREDKALLFVTYALEASGREASWRTRVPRELIAQRVHSLVGQIVDHLNDDVTLPGLEEEAHEGPGSRPVVNNSHAQVMTSANYGGA